MEGKNGRSGHFIKKRSKDSKKFNSNECLSVNDQERDEMLRVAKVRFPLPIIHELLMEIF